MTTHRRLARGVILVSVLLVLQAPGLRAATTLPVAEMDQILGVKGKSLAHGVVRYSWPRSDLKVVVDHIPIAPALALTSWAAFMPAKKAGAIATGDLVLRLKEAPRVMERLDTTAITVTAVQDRLLGESPQVVYLHFVGRGKAAVLAHALRKALEATAMPPRPAPTSFPEMPAKWVDETRLIIGFPGRYENGILSVAVTRADQIRMGGDVLPPAMGVATRLNFQQIAPGKIAATGDFVLVASEVGPVLHTLDNNGIQVTALTSRMLKESPRLFFLHFWAVGRPDRLARALRAALYRTRTGHEE